MQDDFVTDVERTLGYINGCLQKHATNTVDRTCEQRGFREMETKGVHILRIRRR